MSQFTDDDFKCFLKSFEKGAYTDKNGVEHKFLDSLTELSRSDSPPFDALVTCDFQMFGLDWMVKNAIKWRDVSKQCERNPKLCNHKCPKSVDALFCKKNEQGNTELHIIEFKFIPQESTKGKLEDLFEQVYEKNNNYVLKKTKSKDKCFDDDFVEDFSAVRKYFYDKLEYSLQLKPYEAIFIALPGLYEEYCENKNIEKKDIKGYLSKIEKYYWVCIGSGKSCDSDYLRSQAKNYEDYYRRMKPEILNDACVRIKEDFMVDLKEEILLNVQM